MYSQPTFYPCIVPFFFSFNLTNGNFVCLSLPAIPENTARAVKLTNVSRYRIPVTVSQPDRKTVVQLGCLLKSIRSSWGQLSSSGLLSTVFCSSHTRASTTLTSDTIVLTDTCTCITCPGTVLEMCYRGFDLRCHPWASF